MEFVIVSGMSGAGKSGAVKALEDINFYCIDNMPPKLIPKLLELSLHSNERQLSKIAVVMDIRGGDISRDLFEVLSELDHLQCRYQILFLDADDETIIRRYKQTRHKHPLIGTGLIQVDSISQALTRERELLEPIRRRADYTVDTSMFSAMQLKDYIQRLFSRTERESLLIHCMSFGFKYGLPSDADLVFDVRCLPNPFYIPSLKPKTGLEEPVRSYVMQWKESQELSRRLSELLDFLVPLYQKEGKSQLVVAIGCTGGMHRSVVFCEMLASHLNETGYRALATHRDMEKSLKK